MKNIFLILGLFFVGSFMFTSCEEEDELFILTPSVDGVAFSNTFSEKYLLSANAEENIAERFVWNAADFGIQVNVNYDLEVSLSAAFESFDLLATTAENNLAVTVATLLDYAAALELDDDPTTTDLDGNPNNSGVVYFRVRAYAGSGTGNSTELRSDPVGLNIELLEESPSGECNGLFGLGDALVDAQWNWNTALEIPCNEDILSIKLNLQNGTFRFFSVQDDWASGLNYPYFVEEGYTIDAAFEDAMDGDNNFRFVGTPGIYELVIDDNEKTLALRPSGPLWLLGDATPGGWDWGGATPAVESAVDVWSVSLELINGTFRFFSIQDDWGSGLNYPHFIEEGYTIDAGFEDAMDGDNNFRFVGTPGVYELVIDANAKNISLTSSQSTECEDIFALGDALVDAQWDWGAALQFSCSEGVLRSKVNLQNGTFRFFGVQDDWSSGLNYPYFIGKGYMIDAGFEDAMDGDNNFRFVGTPGVYELVIDDNTKTIALSPTNSLWLLGDATPGGWDWGGATPAVENAIDIWSVSLELINGTFRFFSVQDDWGSSLNYTYFIEEGYTIDAGFEDAMDGDNNFRFVGTPGTYILEVNAIEKTITLNQ